MGRVFQYRVGSGLGNIPDIGLDSGLVRVLKYAIRYFWVSILVSGISGYFWVFQAILDIICFFGGVEPNIKFFSNIY